MLWLWAGVWIVPYGAYYLWRFQYYGHLFPNTFYVKASGLTMLPAGLEYLLYAAQRFHLYVLLLPAVVLLPARRGLGIRKETLWLSALIVLPYLGMLPWSWRFHGHVPICGAGDTDCASRGRANVACVFMSSYLPDVRGGALGKRIGADGGRDWLESAHVRWDSQKIWFRHNLDSIGLLPQLRRGLDIGSAILRTRQPVHRQRGDDRGRNHPVLYGHVHRSISWG